MHPFDHVSHLRLDFHRPECSLPVLSCKGFEALSQPYCYELEVSTPHTFLKVHELLFSAGSLYADIPGTGVHGYVHSILRCGFDPVPGDPSAPPTKRYRITFGPRLGLMAYRHNRRIFQGMCAEQIVAQLMSEHGINRTGFSWSRKSACRKRAYCSQYCESDLQLLQRLCAEEGMHYYFRQLPHRHAVVFTDTLPKHLPLPLAAEPVARPSPASRKIGMQRACVVGDLFEIAKMDKQGRLNIRFDWGNQGDGARFNNCWVPVDPQLVKGGAKWWGGMEVVVNFKRGNPERPYISDRLWDPDINPQLHPEVKTTERRVITTRIDQSMLVDKTRELRINTDFIVRMAQKNEMFFRVGDSQVTIDSKNVSMTGLTLMLSGGADAG